METTFEKTYRASHAIMAQVNKVIIGKPEAVKLITLALICGGHVLIEDVPGVGKTTIAAALARAAGLDFSRIQLTPDVMASDITGFSVPDRRSGEFVYRPGAVMTNILIADEINRTSPKTQSALLEAMEEGQVTVDGVTRPLSRPFMVIATENPLGFVGTYPLPEAQLDRFLLKFEIGYPSGDEEMRIITDRRGANPLTGVSAVASAQDIIDAQRDVSAVYADSDICRYIIELVQATRGNKDILLAASPRASIALMRAASANAVISGRNYVIPQDVSDMYKYVVGHRILLSAEARLEHVTASQMLDGILAGIKAPVLKKQ